MPYTVVGLLGRGGSGVVELVEDERGRRRARKRLALHGSAYQLDAARRRLRREAEALRRLAHPGIVTLIDVEDDGESVVLTMPWMAGGSLHDRVSLHGPLAATVVEDLAAALLPALAAAHEAGIVHRDISPANILFSAEGHPVLADFGTASCRAFTGGLTGTGTTIGTPGYMAPEQARGDTAGPPADVFALGACLHFALTGRSPIAGSSSWAEPLAVVQRAAAGALEPLPASVPEPIAGVVRSLCQVDPSARPAAAETLPGPLRTQELLAPTLVPEPAVRARRRRPAGRDRRRWRRAGVLLLAVAGAAAAVGLGFGLVTRPSDVRALPTTTAPAPQSTAPPCQPLPYQPCGRAPAPFTNGQGCVDRHDDLDGMTANGCEAAPDGLDGAQLATGQPLFANLVPRTESDRYTVRVPDRFQLFCNGAAHATLTAPAGVTQQLAVSDPSGRLLGTALSRAAPATIDLPDGNCLGDDAATLTLVVSPVTGVTADDYQLVVTGSF